MTKKLILTGLFVILVLAIPVTSAQQISKSFDYILECPINNSVFTGIYFYNNTDYAFDNFTISIIDIEIFSTAYLFVSIYEQREGTDYNQSWHPIFTGVLSHCNLDLWDLGLEDEVFNATAYPYWARSSTEEITGFTYSVILPYYLIVIENVDSVDAVIELAYTIAVETHGDREAEFISTPRNATTTVYQPIFQDYYYFDDEAMLGFLIGVLLIGFSIGVLFVLVSQGRFE